MSSAPADKKITTGFLVSPKDWPRTKAVLTIAARLEGEERTQLVEAQLPDEPTLRVTVLSMLDTYDKTKRALGPDRTDVLSSPETPQLKSAPALASEEPIRAGEEYGPYRVVRKLGAGGMGQVFLAEDTRLRRLVALKSLVGRWLTSPTARQRLLREARAAAALSHPNIATLYDVLEDKRYFLLVMEYVEGRTAGAVLAEGPIPLGHAVRVTIQICDAIMYAHDRGIIHCDLKPSNVQVLPDGAAKVLDFGLAHAKYDSEETDADPSDPRPMLIGTPAYMPPERLVNGALNASGDIYSLGVTLFEMVTGRRPFEENDFAALTGAILGIDAPRVSSFVPDVPPKLDDVIARAVAKDPKQRYQTAREFGRDLREVLRVLDIDSGIVAFPSAPAASTTRSLSRGQLAGVVITALVAIVTVAGFLTSLFYNSPLGITMAFDGESPVMWPYWGVRSLILPLAQVSLVLLILGVFGLLGRILRAAFAPLRRWREGARREAVRVIEWSMRTATLDAGLLSVQVISFGLFCWRFRDTFSSFHNFVLQSGSLLALSPDLPFEHGLYMRVLSLLLLFFGWSWYRLLKLKSRTRRPTSATILAGAAVMMALTFCVMAAPYRVFYHSDGERVLYQSEQCYLVGKKGNEASLFCPQQGTPWQRLVDLNDPALIRTGTTENIFSGLSVSEPKSLKIP